MKQPTPERSAIMRAVRAKDTTPEIQVRRFVHSLGYRYRLHRKDLPGKPDMVFPKRRKVIVVHGCFWHGHSCKRGDRTPKTNREYWEAKIGRNRKRDAEHHKALESLGWQTLVVWECQLNDPLERGRVESDIAEYLCEAKVLATPGSFSKNHLWVY